MQLGCMLYDVRQEHPTFQGVPTLICWALLYRDPASHFGTSSRGQENICLLDKVCIFFYTYLHYRTNWKSPIMLTQLT
jgi:hypothetical protein